jgi:hypothetical protein
MHGPLMSCCQVTGCEVVWVVKDDYIGNTFFDASASHFIVPELQRVRTVVIHEPKGSMPADPSSHSSTSRNGKRRRSVTNRSGFARGHPSGSKQLASQ